MFLWVSDIVMVEASLIFSLMRITPKEISNLLVILRVINSKLNLKGSLDLFDSFNVLDGWTNTSMATKHSLLFVIDNSCERHLFKSLIDLGKHTIWIINVLS